MRRPRPLQVFILAVAVALALLVGGVFAYLVKQNRAAEQRDADIVQQNQYLLRDLLRDHNRQDACLLALSQVLVDPTRDRFSPVPIPLECAP